MDASNGASPGSPDLGRPQSAARVWFEPLVRLPFCSRLPPDVMLTSNSQLIVCLMIGSLILNRRRSYKIIPRGRDQRDPTSENLLRVPGQEYDSDNESAYYRSRSPSPIVKAKERCCGIPVDVPDSSHFGNHIHSRILQKFPFLVEMFYWALNYVAYAMTKQVAASVYGRGGSQVTEMAQDNGINILTLEHNTIFSIFFPIGEVELQQFFLGHPSVMTFFNQIYSLVHIPGTVAYVFFDWTWSASY
jgi:hypothetical protein